MAESSIQYFFRAAFLRLRFFVWAALLLRRKKIVSPTITNTAAIIPPINCQLSAKLAITA